MTTWERTTFLPGATARALFDWHMRPGAFQRLRPPWERMDLLHHDEPVRVGGDTRIRVYLGPLYKTWLDRIVHIEEGRGFVDEQVAGPMRAWRHEHRFDDAAGGATLTDRVTFEPPWVVSRAAITARLDAMFRRRHLITAEDLARHAAQAHLPRLRVGVTGATGLIGQELAAFLRGGGHTVVPFTRGDARGGIPWDPSSGRLDPAALADLDAIVHLAGEPIAARWTPAHKDRVRQSRVGGTSLLAAAIARCPRPPRVLVSCSAVGWYGSTDDDSGFVDESSPRGDGFLADVGVEWEAAAEPARAAGVRVTHPRMGIVVSGHGGLLPSQLTLARACLQGPVGTGRQGISWVALDDVVDILHRALRDETLAGPINVTAPTPVAQAELAAELAQQVGRPLGPPAPAAAIRILLGEMGEELVLRGARVLPARLTAAGYRWRRPTLRQALTVELGHLED
jgi:uncharacterized protein (TIGR01777 family)